MLFCSRFEQELFPDYALTVIHKDSKKPTLIPFMQRTPGHIITFFCILLLWGCSGPQQQSWMHLIPKEITFVIVPKTDVDFTTISTENYSTILDDLTPAALGQVSSLPEPVLSQLRLKALAMYPAGSTESQFIWIAQSTTFLDDWAPGLYEPFEQNNYLFNEIIIHKLHINDAILFAAQIHDWVIISQSSRAVERSLGAYLGVGPSIDLPAEPTAGQLILNSEEIDHWVQQFVAVGYRPMIMDSFIGLSPVSLQYIPNTAGASGFRFEGSLQLKDTTRAVLVDALTGENKELSLDRFVASNSAAFGLFRLPASYDNSMPAFNPSPLDSLLAQDDNLFRNLSLTLDSEFGVVVFPESGLLANGEFLFLRKMSGLASFKNQMDTFADSSLVIKQGDSYYIRSATLARLIGSELAPFNDFYLSFSRDVAVISKRRGLSESVEADRTRRRTVYYDESYNAAKRTLPTSVSGFVWSHSSDLLKFIDPFLMPNNTLRGLLGSYDITSMSFSRRANSDLVDFTFKSETEEGSIQPYDELWVLPINQEELTGKPVIADIVGSSADEIIFSTQTGNVEALAFDGTSVMQASTGTDIPIGSPVLYDWYGNGQPIIIQAAGTKIYAWNEGGNPLPQFPIEIGERISAPIVVTDVLRNGIPEIIVATENRKIHVIDGRGQNVRGWPQFTNAIVTKQPVFEQVDDSWSIWVFSQNILHSWLRNGLVRPGYPTFINASFTSEPLIFKNQILGAASDGYMYSIGQSPSFKDSLAISIQMDSISIKALYATNSPLNKIAVKPNVLMRDSSGFYRADLFMAQSINGSLMLFNQNGELEITHNMGQPASESYAPQILDINGDNLDELIALADFGRLFAWEVLTSQRLFTIPTSGMKYPVIADLNDDGLYELIASTREGLRCWTINIEKD